MTVGVGEERHPQVMIRHARDPMGWPRKHDAASGQFPHRQRNIGAGEIDRRGVIGIRPFLQQQADPGTVEKSQIAVTIQMSQAKHVAIKCFRDIDVPDSQGDLSDAVQGKGHRAYSASRKKAPISPMIPRRNASTHSMKIAPWITVTHAPACAR